MLIFHIVQHLVQGCLHYALKNSTIIQKKTHFCGYRITGPHKMAMRVLLGYFFDHSDCPCDRKAKYVKGILSWHRGTPSGLTTMVKLKKIPAQAQRVNF